MATAMAQSDKFNPEIVEIEVEESKTEGEKEKNLNALDENIINGNNGTLAQLPSKVSNNCVLEFLGENPYLLFRITKQIEKPLLSSSNASNNSQKQAKIPPVPPEVLRTACERHQKGLMSPHIYQILTQVTFNL